MQTADTADIVIGFATSNQHKIRETRHVVEMLAPEAAVIAIPLPEVEENAQTFCENAVIKLKARLECTIPEEVTHLITEDAGLIIDGLDGLYGISPFPGVKSHRWFSAQVQQELFGRTFPPYSYDYYNQGILMLMRTHGVTNRSARYEACMALWDRETGNIQTFPGSVPLAVADEPRGDDGFGYDPIMIPVEYDPDRTMAQLSAEEKNRISHRYQALSGALRYILATSEGRQQRKPPSQKQTLT